MTPDIDQFKKNHEEWKHTQQIKSIDEVHDIFNKWLWMIPNDHETLEITLSGALDQKIPGDPSWWYLIGVPGSSKTVLIDSMHQLPCVYSLDTLTTATFVSGLTKINKETEEPEPVGGLLKKMNGKTLMVKDFTTILTSPAEKREELYGQFRAIYDGKFEKGFGTLPDPIRIDATIGLVLGVTPIIDHYTALQSTLGERFLKRRVNTQPLEAAARAYQNEGCEKQQRMELQNAVHAFVEKLDFTHIPVVPEEFGSQILAIGMYIAKMRANAWRHYNSSGQVVDVDALYAEVPTRVTKQLKHTAKLLAIIRGHEEVGESEMATLGRVAMDTADQKRQGIINVFAKYGWRAHILPNDIAAMTPGLWRANIANHLTILEYLEAIHTDDKRSYYLDDDFALYAKTVFRINTITDPERKMKIDDYRTLPLLPVTNATQKQPLLDKCSRCLRPIGVNEPKANFNGFLYCENCKEEIVKERLDIEKMSRESHPA